MVLSNKKQFAYVLAVAISAKAEEGALQTTVGVKVIANGNGVGKVGGPVFRHLSGRAASSYEEAVALAEQFSGPDPALKSLEEAVTTAEEQMNLAEEEKLAAYYAFVLSIEHLNLNARETIKAFDANEYHGGLYDKCEWAHDALYEAGQALAEYQRINLGPSS